MQDADEAGNQGAQGLVVHVAGGAVRSTRSALPMLPPVGFSGPPPEPGVHCDSSHPNVQFQDVARRRLPSPVVRLRRSSTSNSSRDQLGNSRRTFWIICGVVTSARLYDLKARLRLTG